jgi:TPR repeat protein
MINKDHSLIVRQHSLTVLIPCDSGTLAQRGRADIADITTPGGLASAFIGEMTDYARAMRGDVSAQLQLGDNYLTAKGVDKDTRAACYWYGMATKQGDPDGQRMLALMYANGEGVELDFVKAVRWSRKAAAQGDTGAQYDLGVFYLNGTGVKQNYTKALDWFHKAAMESYASAQHALGIMYANGHGVAQSYAKAAQWYRKAAQQGNANAQQNLIELFAVRPIDDLELSLSCVNALKADNIYYIGELIQLSENEVLRTPNVSRKSLGKIKK